MQIRKSYIQDAEAIIEFSLNDQHYLASVQKLLGEQVIRCYPQDGNGNVTDIGSVAMPQPVLDNLTEASLQLSAKSDTL
ncbi:MAG: hypothetical protein ACOX0Y_03345 [Thiopseudomonas sp.]